MKPVIPVIKPARDGDDRNFDEIPLFFSTDDADEGATNGGSRAVLVTEEGLVKPRPSCANKTKRRSTADVFIISQKYFMSTKVDDFLRK